MRITWPLVLVACSLTLPALAKPAPAPRTPYEFPETRELVAVVTDAAELVRTKGEAAFPDFRVPGSRWRNRDHYIMVLEPDGITRVHIDPKREGANELDVKDPNGKPIVRGLIEAATGFAHKSDGWYHYQWPAPTGGPPLWKSTYVRAVTAPSGKKYVVGSGIYNDRMERAFVVDLVNEAAELIEKDGHAALKRFADPTGPFVAKDAYIFVHDLHGKNLYHPSESIADKNVLDLKDSRGKHMIREMNDLARKTGSGWVDYMWPKPGEEAPSRKSTYIRKAKLDGEYVVVGCGVYLPDAPK